MHLTDGDDVEDDGALGQNCVVDSLRHHGNQLILPGNLLSDQACSQTIGVRIGP